MSNYATNERIAVVTGGAQGIGFAVAERLVKSGAALASWDGQPRDLLRTPLYWGSLKRRSRAPANINWVSFGINSPGKRRLLST